MRSKTLMDGRMSNKYEDVSQKIHSTENHPTNLSMPFSLSFAPLGSLNCCEHHRFVSASIDGPGLCHPSQCVLRAHTDTSLWPSTHRRVPSPRDCKAPPPEGAPFLLFNNSLLVAYLSSCVCCNASSPSSTHDRDSVKKQKLHFPKSPALGGKSIFSGCPPTGGHARQHFVVHTRYKKREEEGLEDRGLPVQRPRQREKAASASAVGHRKGGIEQTTTHRHEQDTDQAGTYEAQDTFSTRETKDISKETRIHSQNKSLLVPPCERCRAPKSPLVPRKLTMPHRKMTFASSSALFVQAC